jgi:hypothetical protein
MPVHGIWAAGAGSAWAVGPGGQALRLSGGSWSPAVMPGATVHMRAVAGSAAGRVFAVGDSGYVALTEEGAWKADLSNDPKSRDLLALWVLGDKEAWALGAAGALVHFTGGKWNIKDIDGTYMKTATFFGVWGGKNQGGDLLAWAVGPAGAGLRFEGGKWLDRRAETTADLEDVTALPDGRLVACGGGGLLLVAADGKAEFADLGVEVTAVTLHAVAAEGSAGFAAVGEGGVVVRVGAATTVEQIPGAKDLHGVALAGPALVAVGAKGQAFARAGSSFVPEKTGTGFSLLGLDADDKGVAFAVGEYGTTLRRSSDGTWTKEKSGETEHLHDVLAWGDGEAVAVGEGGVVILRSGGTWKRVHQSPGLYLYGVERLADGRILAVGWAGALVLGQGESWQRLESGVANVLLSLATSAKGTVAVGKKGGIYQVTEKLP